MRRFRLDVEAAGIEADAFANERNARITGIAPFQLDQPWRPLGGAPDGMNKRKIRGQKIVTDCNLDIRSVAAGECPCRLFKFRRAHIVGRCVDKIARQRHGFDDAVEILAVNALRQIELGLVAFGLAVAREAIGTEREGECRKPRVMRIVGKPVNAAGKKLGQGSGKKRVLGVSRRLDPEQDSAKSFVSRQT